MRVASPQQKYLDDVFGLHDPELAKVRAAMQVRDVEGISVSPAEARILQFLIRAFNIQNVVEFGTLYGYSALAMAKALPANGRLITLEKNPDTHAQAQAAFQASDMKTKIQSLCGDAVELAQSLKGPFDMVFIDANKSAYLKYLDWAEQNVRKGGLIAGDNTFLWGAVWGDTSDARGKQAEVMIEFNRRLADPARYNSILIPTAEGLTVAQKL